MYFNNILETIGNTPLVKLNSIMNGVTATILAKIETTNPGNSIKDRMALKMIIDAEKAGHLKPGGTIVEGTSGNTGMGLAIAGVIKGYKCIFVTNDKQSKEKVDLLKAVGAEVIVCPTNVEPDDPRSYYSVSRELSKQIPGAYYVNQYDNPANVEAHYESTGPEIWEQTEGKITHLVVGVGTGGTISGVGRYLKEKNPNIKVWGIDTYGSVFKKYHETGEFDTNEIYPYITEGIGEDILPKCVDFSIIDKFEKVTDKDGLLYQRRLAREEGILVGNSAGSAVAGVHQLKDELNENDVVVVIFHDHASRYVGKAFNDEWMRERGFMQEQVVANAADLVAAHKELKLITVATNDKLVEAYELMKKYNISQIPVLNEKEEFVGSLDDCQLLNTMISHPDSKSWPVLEHMHAPFPMVRHDTSISEVSAKINDQNAAVLVKDLAGITHIITRQDIIGVLAKGKN
jgi:cystathionine beta-synthase